MIDAYVQNFSKSYLILLLLSGPPAALKSKDFRYMQGASYHSTKVNIRSRGDGPAMVSYTPDIYHIDSLPRECDNSSALRPGPAQLTSARITLAGKGGLA